MQPIGKIGSDRCLRILIVTLFGGEKTLRNFHSRFSPQKFAVVFKDFSPVNLNDDPLVNLNITCAHFSTRCSNINRLIHTISGNSRSLTVSLVPWKRDHCVLCELEFVLNRSESISPIIMHL